MNLAQPSSEVLSKDLKVLIVDDSFFMRKMLGDIFIREEFHNLEYADDGRDAIIKYQDYKPDIVILDITMPVLDGLEALQEILNINPNASVIMCSALGSNGIVSQALQMGAKGYIVKPFQPQQIFKLIEEVAARQTYGTHG